MKKGVYISYSRGIRCCYGGNTLLGTEDFESFTGGITTFYDPLTQGVPNGPFPAGLTLPMTVQSNMSGGIPTNPNPRGIGSPQALVGVDAPAGFGNPCDVVLPIFQMQSSARSRLLPVACGTGT